MGWMHGCGWARLDGESLSHNWFLDFFIEEDPSFLIFFGFVTIESVCDGFVFV